MKSQFLKIAGVKSEKAFYKKYPNEAAFFKAHPEAKKMQNGGEQDMGQIKKLQQLTDFGNPPMAQFGDEYGLGSVYGQPTYNSATTAVGGINPKAKNPYQAATGNVGSDLNATSFIQPGMDVIKGISMLGQQKKAKQQAKQNSKLTGVMAQAASTRPEEQRRQYVRPEDIIVDPNQLYPSYGVGTNVLAEDGAMIGGNPTEIQNTYDPNSIYTDLGYEPLNDSTQLKSYHFGGKLETAQNGLNEALNSGGFGDFMTGGGGDLLGKLTSQVGSGGYGPTAGNTIGGGLGQAAGTIFGGPVGGMIGKAFGNAIGGLIDPTGRQIKEYNRQTDENVGNIVGQQFGQGIQNQFGSYLEDGGAIDNEHAWVSNSWQPQVITTFGEHKLKDLLQPPNDADMLRAGGHLKSYTPPSAEAMYTGREQLAMGGDLKVYRGEAETISHNPYLPDGGETVMFRGPSHANGGMPITYGQSPVEVEGGEPAVKLQDGGTGEDNMVVFGNLHIPNEFASELDIKSKGQKFKNYVNDLSKVEARQNKIIDKSSNALDDLDVNTSFDQLKMSSLQANLLGANMKLKDIASKKQTAAALQSAINDTAAEHGLVAEHLAKGKAIVDKSKDGKAKYGKDIFKAASGADINPAITQLIDLIKQKGYDYNVTSTERPGAKTAQGRPSRHASGEAADIVFPKLGAGAYNAILQDPEISQFMLDNGLTAINEYDPATLAATKGTGPHIHFGFDKGTTSSDKFRKDASSLYGNPGTPKQGAPVSAEDFNYLKGLYDAAKQQKKGPAVEKFQKEFSRISPEFAKQVLGEYPVTSFGKAKGLKATDVSSNIDSIFGPRTERYMNSLQIAPTKGVGVTNQGVPSTTPITPLPQMGEQNVPSTEAKKKFPWMDIANQAIKYLRPSDAEQLDPNQLMGEFYALTNNQLEPVQAQKYNPQLLTPYDISLQDQLNANQADFNAMQRQVGGNPEALSQLAAQKYAVNSKVLGEQFRANQANKAGIYNQNIQTMNDAQLRNLATLDQQYGRQAQAKSNTKATTQAALNSISSKFAQNKLDNRTLATYENLYNYRYNPNFVAENMNPLQQFNIPEVGTPTNKTAQGKDLLPIYDNKGGITGYKVKQEPATKTKAKNGSIVKAIKNL